MAIRAAVDPAGDGGEPAPVASSLRPCAAHSGCSSSSASASSGWLSPALAEQWFARPVICSITRSRYRQPSPDASSPSPLLEA